MGRIDMTFEIETRQASAGDGVWYAVMTEARAERKADTLLRAIGFETLFLHYQQRIRTGRQEKPGAIKPLFPRYLFVRVGPGQTWRAVNTTPGVAAPVCIDERPMPIPDAVIADLRSRADETGMVGAPKRKAEVEREALPAGADVTIIDGPLKGLPGVVAHDSGYGPVTVAISLFSRPMNTEIAASALRVDED